MTISRRNLLAGAAGLGLLAGCGGGSGGGGTRKLTMWTFIDPNSTTDPRGAVIKQTVAGFNAAHPDTRVEVTSINYAKIDGEVIRAAATGGGPDIVNVYTAQLAQHVQAGTIQPLDDHAGDWLAGQGGNYLFPIDSAKVDGKLMALPWESRVWLLWYRKDLLARYGASAPTTLAELTAAAAKVRKGSGGKVTGMAVGLSEQGLGSDFMEKFVPLTAGAGGQIFDSAGRAAFATDAGARAVGYVKGLADAGAMGREVLTMATDDVINAVKAGTVAMAIEGSYRVASARSGQGVGANLVTAPVPSATAGTPTPTAVAGQTLAMGANTEHPDQVWEFIQYYLSQSTQVAFAKAGVMPVLKPVYDDAAVTSAANGGELRQWRDYLTGHSLVSPFPADYSELSVDLVKAAQRIVFENAPIGSALEQVQKNYNTKRR